MPTTDRPSRHIDAEAKLMRADRSGGPGACWQWSGEVTPRGYPMVQMHGKRVRAHRLAYESTYGPIPDGLVVDHICHSRDLSCNAGDACPHRRCVNPRHLEAVTNAENQRRGRGPHGAMAERTHCTEGHALSAENTSVRGGRRRCRTCDRQADAVRTAKRSALRAQARAARGWEPIKIGNCRQSAAR